MFNFTRRLKNFWYVTRKMLNCVCLLNVMSLIPVFRKFKLTTQLNAIRLSDEIPPYCAIMSIITTVNKQEDLQSQANRRPVDRCMGYIVNKSWRGLQPEDGFVGWGWRLSQVNTFENILGGGDR